jgi:hypothetical protein
MQQLTAIAIACSLPAHIQAALSHLHAYAAVTGVHRTLSVGGPACTYKMHSLAAAAATTALCKQAAVEAVALCFGVCDDSSYSYFSSFY